MIILLIIILFKGNELDIISLPSEKSWRDGGFLTEYTELLSSSLNEPSILV
jgi:hypothetical protein